MEEHLGKTPECRFIEALLSYAKYRERENPQSFQRSDRYRLRALKDWFGEYLLSEITRSLVREYCDERYSEVQPGTAYKDASTLRAILNRAHDEECLAVVPKFPKLKREKPRERWLTPDEEQKLVNSAGKHIVPLIRLATDTGGRLSELLKLKWREVDFNNRHIRFTDTKNGENRTIRLCDRAVATLASIQRCDSEYVFLFRGQPIKSVKTAFSNACQRAGIEDLHFHDLRHTFASRLVQQGVPLYDVAQLMGHKSLEMVQRYAHLAPDYQEKAVAALNKLGHKMGTVEQTEISGAA